MSTQQPPLSLHRLTFVSTLNQDLVADYLAHLRTRHYSPKTLQDHPRSAGHLLSAPAPSAAAAPLAGCDTPDPSRC